MIESYRGIWPQVDPTAYIHPSAVVIGRVTIGAHASIWPGAVLRGDDGEIVVGDYSNIQDGAVIHTTEGLSKAVIGAKVTVGHRVVLHGCVIGDACIIGMGSVLLDNAEVGDHCIVGAASLLTQNKKIPPGMMAFGNPAKVSRPLEAKELAWIEYSWQHYAENAQLFREEADPKPVSRE